MFYKLIQHLISFSTWTGGQWAGALLLLVVIGVLAYELPALLRLVVAPFLLMEMYFMTSSFACGGSMNMFTRASGTQNACTPMDYNQYLAANFGLSHWYVLAGYAGVTVFMLWPVFTKIMYSNKETLELNAEHDALATAASKKLNNIERIGKI